MNSPRMPQRGQEEDGAALIVAITLVVFALGVVVSGSTLLRSNRLRTDTEFLIHGQASSFAQAGLNDALNWLRRQPNQPVADFAPRLDAAATPAVLDTIDPDIGLVREFRISGNVWGRYEVWKPWEGDPEPVRLAWRRQAAARDVTQARDMTGSGVVWSLSSVGYVYRRADPSRPFDQRPNEVLAREYLTTEATRLTIVLPGQAALSVRDSGQVALGTGSRIRGGSAAAGVYHAAGSAPTTGGELTGAPASAPALPVYRDDPRYVFGTTAARLAAMADHHVTDVTQLPATIADDSFVFVDAPTSTFDASRPLRGGGVLYVRGDLVIEAGSSSFFSGLVYVDGDLSIEGPAEIQGAVVVTGGVRLAASGDYATILFSAETLEGLETRLNTYRLSRPMVRAGVRD